MRWNTQGALGGAASGAAIGSSILPGYGTAVGGALGGLAGGFGGGKEERNYQQSTLDPRQQKLRDQYYNSLENQGAGGASGDLADYYRNLLNGTGEDYDAMANPELRRFNEQIIPDIGEQFAGMGSGNLSSSGFRNAAINAGTDLSERLAAIRANLRQQGASGLNNMINGAFNQTTENIHRPREQGFAEQAIPTAGQALASYAGQQANNSFFNSRNNNDQMKGRSDPYGGMEKYQPQPLPEFSYSNR